MNSFKLKGRGLAFYNVIAERGGNTIKRLVIIAIHQAKHSSISSTHVERVRYWVLPKKFLFV